MTFKAPDSLSEQIARHLGEKIITGELKAGERIQELRVAGELDVSRGSVREAYLILERRHLIDILPRRGAVVSEMTPRHVRNVYEVNILLLTQLARRATPVWQESDLPEFLQLLDEMDGYLQRNQAIDFHNASFRFARMAYRFAENPYLEEILEDLQPLMRRTYYYAIRTAKIEMEKSMKMFRDLMECILSRNTDGAVKTLELFGQHQCETVLAFLENAQGS
ncbi:MAG: GntR family transcriptional regulator [Gammaproteobacteria bacterium]|nr:GntR family transcriptional regulator [Gammaproteobacteria bacterium]